MIKKRTKLYEEFVRVYENASTNCEIEVTENAEGGKKAKFVVSAGDYENISDMADTPGFKVFSVDLYTDSSSEPLSDREELKAFLKSLNPNCILEGATAEVVTTETIKIKKKIETDIVETFALTEEIDDLEKKVKALKNLRDPKVQAIIEKMKEVKATSVTVEKDAKKIKVTIGVTKGRTTYPYKEISEALAGVNKKMTDMNDNLKETLKKVNADKEELQFKVEESLGDVKKWIVDMWNKLSKNVSEFFSAAKTLNNAVAKI